MARHDDRSLHVLLVEDEFLVRLTLAEVLAGEGFTVAEAATADAGLAAIEADADLGVLLTDIQIPGRCDGVQLARLARSLRPDMAVIFLSGHPDKAADSDGVENAAFIAKPYLPSVVVATIRRIAKR